MKWHLEPPRTQEELLGQPYDRWILPNGTMMAEFRHTDSGYLLRFPGQADFSIKHEAGSADHIVTGWPTPECDEASVTTLVHNAIEPMLGNHLGGWFLHGSAVEIGAASDGGASSGAIAFLGLSRGGKTTLAGSFAKAGYPFLTEDVIDLDRQSGEYWLKPKLSKLRLFADSARHLLGESAKILDENLKHDVDASNVLPFGSGPAPLRQIYILGTDLRAPLSIRQLNAHEALTALLPHAFILDVEDKPRLKGHFVRMADLSQDIECYALDFTRDYSELARVRAAILSTYSGG